MYSLLSVSLDFNIKSLILFKAALSHITVEVTRYDNVRNVCAIGSVDTLFYEVKII